MSNEEFNELFRQRTKTYAVRVLNFIEKLPMNQVTRTIVFQLGKSVTSIGANYRAFCRGRSKKELYAKICIVVEEADETVYWLELIKEASYDKSAELEELINEGIEILKIVAKTKNTLES